MNKCIGYAKPEDWIPAARNKRITDGGKGKIGVGEERPALSNSQFCCNFATPVKLLNLGMIGSGCVRSLRGLVAAPRRQGDLQLNRCSGLTCFSAARRPIS